MSVIFPLVRCPWKKKNDDASFKQCCHPLQKDGGSVSAACTAPAQTNTSPGEQQPTSSSSYAPAATPTSSNSGSETYTGGHGTYFYQNGVAGACGTVHNDNDNIVAVDYRRYGDLSKQSDLCGKKVLVTNTNNGKSVVCTVADACPTCDNGNSLDLSEGAFKSLASLDEGLIPIKYTIL
ncbi:hypothetical protein BN14_06350 [Rhizoctonia solani AG-1 IB]|uniref:RlpA-like protein double-psi beta-barrel domain-containing protein n=1 Tax=Thanatephorus cucumeris (strain AG1-IB / isolate 7/3/14) TaxID=1108050 RepID=M5BYH0_THACB|nr:hypothetical protein BN14_06350 [Rhizoctonia solani AG-1 IB]